MEMRISEFAEKTGVSVRTLRFYDELGLLNPSRIDRQSGYRFYDGCSEERMHQILSYRELEFPLREIRQILDAPDYDRRDAIARQKQLLTLKRDRLDALIAMLEAEEKGERTDGMLNNAYEDQRAAFEREAVGRWGKTEAYRAFEKQTAGYKAEDWNDAQSAMNRLIDLFAQAAHVSANPEDPAVQELVQEWRDCIGKYYYPCSTEILRGLGDMYISDQRFTENLERHGKGTAKLMYAAIKTYCERNA